MRACLETLSVVLDRHSPTPYRHMPNLNEASVIWHGDKPLPVEAWSCTYGQDDIFVFVLWPLDRGTRLGLFPLGGQEQSLNTPLIGQWKQADQSLTSTGTFEPQQLTLLPPELPDDYYDDMLRMAGKARTPESVTTLARQVADMFAIKAQEFISSKDAVAASRFIEDHRWTGDIELAERILGDLGNWDHRVVPYIQDLPGRVRGLLLEPGDDGRLSAAVWQDIAG